MKDIEQRINYEFSNPQFLELALTHSSFSNENKLPGGNNNERLEFLGDAVLELAISQYLYDRYPKMSEGDLTKLRAAIVCEPSLARKARGLEIGKYIQIGKGEEQTGGRARDSILSDAVEALIGAIYLDGGFKAAASFVIGLLNENDPDSDNITKQIMHSDYKTYLQEHIQSFSREPLEYVITDEQGPDHAKIFFVSLYHLGKQIGTGKGRTKKEAEQNAAYSAIQNEGLD